MINEILARRWGLLTWLVLIGMGGGPVVTVYADAPDTIVRVKRSIVGVGNHDPLRRPIDQFYGTGFVVANGRYVITNAHVLAAIQAGTSPKATLAVLVPGQEGGQARLASLVLEDKDHDLALLKISDAALPALQLGDSDRVREGENYLFTGFPIGAMLGLRPVTHRAMIAALTPIALPADNATQLSPARLRARSDPYGVFQLDATAYPGNSGSPLYDPETGEVVAIINSVLVKSSREDGLSKPSGISYAIPSRFMRDLLRQAGVSESSGP